MFTDKHLKRVVLTKRSNNKSGYALYGGTLSRIRDEYVMLTSIRIINEFGGITAPKGRERRKFKIEDIISVVLEEDFVYIEPEH